MVMPMVRAMVMHIPGVMETTKNVGINRVKTAGSIMDHLNKIVFIKNCNPKIYGFF